MTSGREHSSHGPSSWARWIRCSGAPEAEAVVPDEHNFEAAEGTVFHQIMDDCMTLGLEPRDFLGAMLEVDGWRIAVDDVMVQSSQDGLAYLRSLDADPDVRLFIEERVDISPWTMPDQFGTSDAIAVNVAERWVVVFDWKYGMEPVYTQENEQLFGYTLGAWQSIVAPLFDNDPSDIKVTFIIEQPRVPGAGGAWDTTMQRVLEFGNFAQERFVLTTDKHAKRTAGVKQCRWCRARTTCGTRAEWILNIFGQDLTDLDVDPIFELKLPASITPERRSYVLERAPQIRAWLDDLHKSAVKDSEAGRPVPRWKLVDGRHPARVWKEDGQYIVERLLQVDLGRDKIWTAPTFKSPAQIEALMGKQSFQGAYARFVNRGKPKAVLVSENDRRKPRETLLDIFE